MDRSRLSRFLRELRPLLNEWDPIGVFGDDADGPPHDEYDCIQAPLVRCLTGGVPEDEAVRRLQAWAQEHMAVETSDASTRRLLRAAAALWDRLCVDG